MKKIRPDMQIEEIIEILPEAVAYLREKGIQCIMCGEPIWETMEEAAKNKNFNAREIESFTKELNQMLDKKQ